MPGAAQRTFHISGDMPPEIWNRLGTKVLTKLRGGSDLKIGIDFAVTVEGHLSLSFENDLKQIIDDLGRRGFLKDLSKSTPALVRSELHESRSWPWECDSASAQAFLPWEFH